MASGAGFYAIDSTSGSWDALDFAVGHDAARFPNCPVAPVQSEFAIHGLNIRQSVDNRLTLYAVGHGGREAIEVFDVDSGDGVPSLTSVGCVEMPGGLPANSVASAADGSLFATVRLMPGKTFADSVAMRPTGMKNDVPECGGPGPQHDLATLGTCPRGTFAIEIDPETMSHRVIAETPANSAFSNATMVLTIGDRFWVGTFSSDRILNGPLS